LFYEVGRKLFGVIEADEIYQTAGTKGRKKHKKWKWFNPSARKRGKKKGPGRGHYKKDTPCIVAWVCRGGKTVLQVVKSFNFRTVKKMANKVLFAGCGIIFTDSAKAYGILSQMGFIHKNVNHSKKEYVKPGNVHENRAENVFSLLKPFLLVFRGVSKRLLPGYVGFFQFLTNSRDVNCFKKAQKLLAAGLDPNIASHAKKRVYLEQFSKSLQF
jgi:transposase-like protein